MNTSVFGVGSIFIQKFFNMKIFPLIVDMPKLSKNSKPFGIISFEHNRGDSLT